jgi:hypothetical protein
LKKAKTAKETHRARFTTTTELLLEEQMRFFRRFGFFETRAEGSPIATSRLTA